MGKLWRMTGIFLIAIFLSQVYIAVPSISQTQLTQPKLLHREEKMETKMMEALNQSILTTTITRIEKWTNGTLLQMIFYHILNPSNSSIQLASNETYIITRSAFISEGKNSTNPPTYYGPSPPPREVIVTYKKWITNATTPEMESASIKTSTIRPLAGVFYPYTAIIDTRQFVLKGEYQGVFATYDHNDNYNDEKDGGVYPLQENTPYILRGSQKPYHIHLIEDLLSSWVEGNISEALAVAASFFAFSSVKELVVMGLEAASEKVAAILESPIVVAILVIWDIVETINKLLEILGLVSQAQWVENVVREHFLGDGWAWRGPISGGEFLGDYWCPFWYKPMRGREYYKWREFKQTWGSEGIFNSDPHEYSVVWLDRTEWDVAPTPSVMDGRFHGGVPLWGW